VINSKGKLAKHLELKLSLFKNMEKILVEQTDLLDQKEIDRFRGKSDDVDRIIEKVKTVDYDIARLESTDESVAGMANSDDQEIRKTVNKILKISRRNNRLLDEIAEKLSNYYRNLKDMPENGAELGRIRAYKTVTEPYPVYFEKHG
jgi:hypothetical protein